MGTGTPFIPASFSTTVVVPNSVNPMRRTPYCSPSEFRFSPTAVGTKALVALSGNPDADSLASLSLMLHRASSYADVICFHRPEGSLGAMATTESASVTAKANGELQLVCNYKPITEVTGLGLGISPSGLTNIDSNTAADIWVDGSVIHVPGSWTVGPSATFPRPVGINGTLWAVWQYVHGFFNTALTAGVTKGATTLVVTPSAIGGTALYGAYANMPITIVDGANTETVTIQSVSGTTITLTAGTAYAHNLPAAPDFIRVTAMPDDITEAIILMTSSLIKLRGTRAQAMPHAPGGMPTTPELAQAGGLVDWKLACKILHHYATVAMHG